MSPFIARDPLRLLTVVFVSAGCRYLFHALDLPADPWHYRTMAGEMMLFAVGGLSYFSSRDLLKEKISLSRLLAALGGWIVIMLFCAARNLIFAYPTIVIAYPVFWEPLGLKDPVFLALVALLCPLIFVVARNSRVDSFFGDLSYPIYLSHGLIGTIITNIIGHAPPYATVRYVLAVTLASAALLFFVEQPIKRFRARRLGARQ